MKQLLIVLMISALSGCSFMIKTPTVANYENLSRIDGSTTKNDVAVLLGAQQGKGIHVYDGNKHELHYYHGFAGKFTSSTALYDSGTAFITYGSDHPVELIYFTSKASGPEISFSKNLSIKKLADTIKLGESKVDAVFSSLGQPDYVGRRINYKKNIDHKIAFWDSSKIETKGAIKEKWILVGYDESGIVQDLIWVSSSDDDIREFGEISEQQMKQLSRMTVAGFIPMLEPTAMNTGTKIDPVQVDALVNKSPQNIKHIIDILGKPTALGIKSFDGDPSMNLSNWSFSTVEMKGRESNYIPPMASEEERKHLSEGKTFMVMSVEQSRLIVGHNSKGEVQEIRWVGPVK